MDDARVAPRSAYGLFVTCTPPRCKYCGLMILFVYPLVGRICLHVFLVVFHDKTHFMTHNVYNVPYPGNVFRLELLLMLEYMFT